MGNTKRIAVIDDEQMIRMNLKDFLEDEGFEVSIFASAEEALKGFENERFAVAIVDIRLPGINGNRFILQAHKLYENTNFIIHTGSTAYMIPNELKDVVPLKSLFIKPVFDMSLIVERVKELLKNQEGLFA